MTTIEIPAFCSIDTAIALALDETDSSGKPVRFEFNGHEVVVRPYEDRNVVYERFVAAVAEARRAWEESLVGRLHRAEAGRGRRGA